ncbi:uncharacterized protein K452DRAFT_286531 [Aplosporella prunicola CBS 121167]|uniref:Spo12-like protein n=1 Tax=Aplosporella prunicola CBS 121167 TaxID=1176127 RepID=A0A6A6BHT0_9PEZI|nr:uncharacterized protein K452DRAFT_286531 [Aplosporella prunicola CBS 121167]KAF2142895.1 hypothetical protein K452DRAFT_286531 [Aplosporella prunicola CBS 121167]
MSASVLSDRDTNAPMKATNVDDGKPKSMEYHRQMLESKMKNGQMEEQTYVSPSDGIQSPATQKLAAFKTKHGLKKAKPQSLFGKMASRNMGNSGAPMFADIPQNKQTNSAAVNQSS